MIIKAGELRKKTGSDLQRELIELRKEQVKLRMQGAGRLAQSVFKPHLLKIVRRNIALVKTILKQREEQQEGRV